MARSGRASGMDMPHGRGGKLSRKLAKGEEKPIHVKFWKPEKKEHTVFRAPSDVIERCIIALFEKRGSTRVAAMADLVGALKCFAAASAEDVGCKYTTIMSRCVFSLKKGSFKEACLAYRSVGLLALALAGGDGDGGLAAGEVSAGSKDVLAEAFPFLARTVEASNDMARVVAAVDGLTAATFAGADGDDEIERSMDAIWRGVIDPTSGAASTLAGEARKTTPEVLAAAVSAWAFLLTAVHDRYEAAAAAAAEDENPGETSCNDKIELLVKLLDADDRAVRMAAGEALAACVELKLTHSTSPEDMESLKTTISNLAAEPAGNGAGDKRRHADQKDTFRQIEAFLEDGDPPEKSVRTSATRQGVLKVTTWTKLLQLNFLARFLGNGFHSHLHSNRLFGETFKIAGDEVEGMEAAKKKLSRRWKEKKWSLERRRCRDAVWMEKNKFGLPEEEPESGGTMALMLLPAPANYHHMLPPPSVHRQSHMLPPLAPATASHMLPPVEEPVLLLDYY